MAKRSFQVALPPWCRLESRARSYAEIHEMAKSTYHPSIPAEHSKHFGAIALSSIKTPSARAITSFWPI